MRISYNPYTYIPKTNNKVNFKGRDWFAEGGFDDDPYSRAVRDKISEGMYARIFGIGPEGDASSTDMRYADSIEDVKIMNFRSLGKSSYSGESLVRKPEYFKLLGHSGVTKVIDLVDNPKLKEYCDKYNLGYYSYDMNWGYSKQAIFCDEGSLISEYSQELSKRGLTKEEFDKSMSQYKSKIAEEKTSFVNKFKKLVDEINKGHFYMSCEYGEYRTVNCLTLVSLFNPDWYGEKIEPNLEFAEKIIIMCQNLTDEHKKILGLSEEHILNLKKYILKCVAKL